MVLEMFVLHAPKGAGPQAASVVEAAHQAHASATVAAGCGYRNQIALTFQTLWVIKRLISATFYIIPFPLPLYEMTRVCVCPSVHLW